MTPNSNTRPRTSTEPSRFQPEDSGGSMMLARPPARIGAEEEDEEALGPVALHVTVDGLRAADDALLAMLDAVWETDEARLADIFQTMLKRATDFLHSAHADLEGMELGLPKLSEEEEEAAAQGVRTLRSMMVEMADDLVRVSRDDIEEVADLALSASRIFLQLAEGATHRALTALGGGSADETQGVVVEEATDEEIADFYRKRGLEPPPPDLSKKKHEDPAPAPAQRRNPGRRRAPARVLWRPLAPQMARLSKETLPQELRARPLKTAGLVCCVLPFSGAIVLCLPGVLATDLVLQRLYARHGYYLEVLVDDVRQVGRLGYVATRLTARQVYRTMVRQLRKAKADPAKALDDARAWAWDAATHPQATAQAAYGLGKRGIESALGLATFLWTQFRAART